MRMRVGGVLGGLGGGGGTEGSGSVEQLEVERLAGSGGSKERVGGARLADRAGEGLESEADLRAWLVLEVLAHQRREGLAVG